MPVYLYKIDNLHPNDLMGILEFETQWCGIVNNSSLRRPTVPFEPLDLYAGSDRTLRVYIKTPELNVVDLTGATGIMTVKTGKGESVSVLVKEGILGATDEGEIFFYLVPADTASLAIRQYVYSISITLSSGKIYTVMEGVINLLQPV
jgi:hypothetical protein